MGCLAACRWCCCCFVATINVLTTILGITFFVLGCITLSGYWVLSQSSELVMKNLNQTMQDVRLSGLDVAIDISIVHKSLESLFATTAIVFLVLGAVLITVSCLGCYGACLGVPACLIIYAVIVGLVFLAQATVVIIWFADSNMLKKCTRSTLESKVANYKGLQAMDGNTLEMDLLQISLGCCGVDGGDDYNRPGAKWNRTIGIIMQNGEKKSVNMRFPFSCCKFDNSRLDNRNCIYGNASEESTNYRVGCYDKMNSMFDNGLRLNNFFYALAGSLGIDALLIVGALVIFFYKRQQRQEDLPHANVQYKMQPQMA